MCYDPTPEHGGIEPSAAEVHETCVSPEYALNTVWFYFIDSMFLQLDGLTIFCFEDLKYLTSHY